MLTIRRVFQNPKGVEPFAYFQGSRPAPPGVELAVDTQDKHCKDDKRTVGDNQAAAEDIGSR